MELNKVDWYETDFVLETPFEPDQYGNQWYSVKFKGDADSHVWLAKDKPEEDKKYYGHFEKTKSGKKLRFKRDTPPEEPKNSSYAGYKDNSSITLGMVWKTIVSVRGLPEDKTQEAEFWEIVKDHTDELLRMADNIKKAEHEEDR